MILHTIGTSHYLRNKSGYIHLTEAQYRTLCDWIDNRVSETNLPFRLHYHEKMQELVECPFCDRGMVSKDTVRCLLLYGMGMHDSLLHLKRGD